MKIKILITALLTACIFSACKDEKAEEKSQLNEVIKVHDNAMGNSETAVKNKAVLDSLIKTTTDTGKVNTMRMLSSNLASADSTMEAWMHQFNADYTGKSHTEVVDYLHNQRLQVQHVDSLLTVAISASQKYLSPTK